MPELYGKGWRVLGYFIWMLGAGVILDSKATGVGTLLLLVGLALFLMGAWQSRSVVGDGNGGRVGEGSGASNRS